MQGGMVIRPYLTVRLLHLLLPENKRPERGWQSSEGSGRSPSVSPRVAPPPKSNLGVRLR